MKNLSKIIESYLVLKHSEDLYCLQINTVDRWIDYHNYTDYEFLFGDAVENGHKMSYEELREHTLEVEEFLPKDKRFLTTVHQEKDQLCFYYINIDLLTDKSKDIILADGGYIGKINKIKSAGKKK
jgi:hypothetical protein